MVLRCFLHQLAIVLGLMETKQFKFDVYLWLYTRFFNYMVQRKPPARAGMKNLRLTQNQTLLDHFIYVRVIKKLHLGLNNTNLGSTYYMIYPSK